MASFYTCHTERRMKADVTMWAKMFADSNWLKININTSNRIWSQKQQSYPQVCLPASRGTLVFHSLFFIQMVGCSFFSRCLDSPNISAGNVKTKYKEDPTFSSFGKIIVESTIDISMFKNNSTVTCEASNTIDRRSAFFNFAIKGNFASCFWNRIQYLFLQAFGNKEEWPELKLPSSFMTLITKCTYFGHNLFHNTCGVFWHFILSFLRNRNIFLPFSTEWDEKQYFNA